MISYTPTIAQAASLLDDQQWFSIPSSGNLQLDYSDDQLIASGRGSAAYRNKINFDSLSFEISHESPSNDTWTLIQFMKEDRASYIGKTHTNEMNNYGYGLIITGDNVLKLIKMTSGWSHVVLLEEKTAVDFSKLQKITIDFAKKDKNVTIRIHVNGETYEAEEHALEDRYQEGGYIGLTHYGQGVVTRLQNVEYNGQEVPTNLEGMPEPLYLVDLFEEQDHTLLHWKYNELTDDYIKVIVTNAAGDTVGEVAYPTDRFIVPDGVHAEQLFITAVNIDGNRGERQQVTRITDNQPRVQQVERIAIHPGEEAYFYQSESGKAFVPIGMNYMKLRMGDHSTFDADTMKTSGDYDPYDAETLLKMLKRDGYNTVRVFIIGRNDINPGIGGDYSQTAGIYDPYMDNVIDFLQRARAHGIYVLPAFGDGELPLNQYFEQKLKPMLEKYGHTKNVIPLTDIGIAAKAEYVTMVLNKIKASDPELLKVLLGVELQNELYVDSNAWPFTVQTGSLTMPNGKSYDMSNVDQRQQMYEESIIHYLNTMVSAIKQVDPELLVTEGIFTMKAVGKMPETHKGVLPNSAVDSRYPPTADILGRSDLDFLDIHLYHTTSDSLAFSVKQNLVSVNYYLDEVKALRKSKPFILGEFGSFKHVDADVEEALVTVGQIRDIAMKDGFKGYLYWTFDTFEQKDMYNAMYGDGRIYTQMSSYPIQLEDVPVSHPTSLPSRNWLAWGLAAGVAVIGGWAWLGRARKTRGGKK